MSYFSFVLQVGMCELTESRVEVEKRVGQQTCQFNISMKLHIASSKKTCFKSSGNKKKKN